MAKKHDEHPSAVPEERSPERPSDGEKPPPHGTQRKAEPGAAVPRVVNPLERAPDRTLQRFKFTCKGDAPYPVLYVLAKAGDEEGARKCYLDASGLAAELEKRRKAAGAKAAEVPDPELVVTPLED